MGKKSANGMGHRILHVLMSNFGVKCDKHPADCCAFLNGSEVISVVDFVVGACALRW